MNNKDDNKNSKFKDLLNYLMDKVETIFPVSPKRNDFLESNNDLEELDDEVLFSVLDHIARTEPRKIISVPTQKLMENIEKERSINLLNNISKLMRSCNWANITEDTTARPQLCYSCESDNCSHILDQNNEQSDTILEIALRRCSHKNNEDSILDCCINCIIDASKEMKKLNSVNDIILIWDTEDTANYYYWIENMNLEQGYSN